MVQVVYIHIHYFLFINLESYQHVKQTYCALDAADPRADASTYVLVGTQLEKSNVYRAHNFL